MKGLYKRIISGVLVLVIIFLMCSPVAFASSVGSLDSYKPITFWDWVESEDNLYLNFFKSIFDKDKCPKSPNTNGLHEFVKANTTVDGKFGLYYVCKHCGKSAGEVGEEAYQQQVSDLPASGYNSAGRLVWSPSYDDYQSFSSFTVYVSDLSSVVSSLPLTVTDSSSQSNIRSFVASLNGSGGLHFSYRGSSYVRLEVPSSSVYPVTGAYRMLSTIHASYSALKSDGSRVSDSENYSESSKFSRHDAGSVFYWNSPFSGSSDTLSYEADFYFPVYEIIPDTAIDTTPGGQYSINTRPTTITGGNYGIVGDDNQITTVNDNRKIVNEGDNIYYNPATGEEKPITNWSYDYGDRTYKITVEGGDTYTVTYGDENISIVEGDINYTIYYMIDGSGESHTHEWYKTGERQATCLVPAQRTYTCSVCGEQKTETDPVLGHSWHAIKTVTTQYDENGNMTQEGYTIYECERCGEQYKSTNDTGLPPSGGGGSGGGSGSNGGDNIFSGIFGVLWDFCTFFFDFFSSFVVDGIKGFIKGLLDAGSDFFSILNPFDWGY